MAGAMRADGQGGGGADAAGATGGGNGGAGVRASSAEREGTGGFPAGRHRTLRACPGPARRLHGEDCGDREHRGAGRCGTGAPARRPLPEFLAGALPRLTASAAALIVFALVFLSGALPASAQTVDLVSNTGETLGSGGDDAYQAQSFTTGANADGYTISEVQISMFGTSGARTSVKIRDNNADNEPGDLVATLTNPGSLSTTQSLHTFTAPANTTLAANTTYWISVNEGVTAARASVGWTSGNGETGQTGWSIGDGLLWRSSEADEWSTDSVSIVLLIKGTVAGSTTNTAPTASNNTVTTAEETAYTFQASDFGFSDDDTGDTLSSVTIVTLPGADKGTLAVSGTAVSAGDVVTAANIASLTYTPPDGESGTGFASFTFKVSDGTDESADSYTMTIDVTAAPSTTALVSNVGQTTSTTAVGLADNDYAQAFTTGDSAAGYVLSGVGVRFHAVGDASATYAVGIWSSDEEVDSGADSDTTDEPHAKLADLTCGAPAVGTVACAAAEAGYTLAANTTYLVVVDSSSNAANSLSRTFSDAEDSGKASGWSIENDALSRSRSSTGAWSSTSASRMIRVNGTAKSSNAAPTASDGTVTTAGDTEYTFKASDFNFADTDASDTLASVKITTVETAGDLELDGTDVELNDEITKAEIDAGDLTFTPASGQSGTGHATFGFKVSDGTDESASAYTMTVDVTAAPPTVTEVAVTSTPRAGTDTYGAGEKILFTITFSAPVAVTGEPHFTFSLGNSGSTVDKDAAYESGSGTTALVFAYTVLATDQDDNGIFIEADGIELDSGEHIRIPGTTVDADLDHEREHTQSGHKVDGSLTPGAPTVTEVSVTSTPRAGTDTYGAGEKIRFTITFSAPVAVTGEPHFTFSLGNSGSAVDKDAAYESGSGTDALVFAYTVLATDADDNGIFIEADGIELDSGEHIREVGTTVDADLDHEREHTQSGHKVDGTLTPPPPAGTVGTLVSNTGETLASIANPSFQAQSFTTGAYAGGYTISEVQINLLAVAGSTSVKIRENSSSNRPGDLVATLTNPDSLSTTATLNTFTAPANTVLEASTTYWISVNEGITNRATFRTTESDSETGVTGWSIGNTRLFRTDEASSWTTDSTTNLVLLIKGALGSSSTNTAPTASNNTVTTAEDTAYTFSASDFNFSDTDTGDTLSSVTIVTLPGTDKGILAVSGTAVSAGDVVTAANIASLTYTPPDGESGTSFASFTFKVSDGTDVSTAAYTMTIDVTAAPSTTALVSNVGQSVFSGTSLGISDQAQAFTTGDNSAGYTLTGVEVRFHAVGSASATYAVGIWSSDEEVDGSADPDTLPEPQAKLADLTCGALAVGNVACTAAGTGYDLDADTTYLLVVDSSSSAANFLSRTNSDNEDAGKASGWSIRNTSLTRGRSSSGGWTVATSSRMIRVNGTAKTAANTAPTASDNTVTTAEDTAYTFQASDFGFADDDSGDTLSSVTIVTLPGTGKGTLAVDGSAVSAGDVVTAANIANLTYTPPDGESGTGFASFTFKVSDGTDESADAYTMTIDVMPAPPPVTATALVSNTGETVGSSESGAFQAQSFTTGANASGYTISEVQIRLRARGSRASARVRIRANNADNQPGDEVATLTNPDSFSDTASLHTFTAPANTVLEASTTYWISVHEGVALGALLGRTAGDGETGETGWSIGNGRLWRNVEAEDWSASTDSLVMVIKGAAITNTAPTASDGTVTTAEDTAYTFTADDFNFADDDTGDALASVKITTLPGSGEGSLELDGTAIGSSDLPQTVTKAQLDDGDLVYDPPSSGTGTSFATFRFKVNDGTDDSADAYSMTIDVTAAPATAAALVSNTGETLVSSGASNFQAQSFTTGANVGGYTISEVQMHSSAASATSVKIRANNADNRPGDLVVTLTNPDSFSGLPTLVTFTAPANTVLAASTTYWISVNEGITNRAHFFRTASDGETGQTGWSIGNGRLLRDSETANWGTNNQSLVLLIKGAAKTNTAPAAADGTVTTAENTAYTFQASDFSFRDADGDALASVKITTVETAGDLELDGTDVELNDVITKAEIDAGDLTFTPAAGASGNAHATFGFKVNDGTAESASAYTMTIDVTAAPLPANTLVSNTGQTGTSGTSLGLADQAQAFTTGGNAPGYTLTGVQVRFFSVTAASVTYDVAIWSSDEEVDSGADSDGIHEPQAKLADLTCGALAAGNVACTAGGTGYDLAANTTYLFVMDSSDGTIGNGISETASDDEDAGGAPGWSIADNGLWRGRASTGGWNSTNDARLILVTGTAKSNTAPTASDGTVTTAEDTAYTFSASDFNFADADAADTLASVTIVTIPGTGKGTLAVSGTAVSAGDVVTAANLASLTYTPPDGDSGDGFASFTFKVNDGTVDSTAAYTMTIDVTAASTPANTLVSNTGQTSPGGTSLGTSDLAQAFTTGGNGSGYTLTGVQVRFHAADDTSATYDVDIWSSDEVVDSAEDSDTLHEPKAKLADLTCEATAVGNVACAADGAGFDLDANTPYLLVVDSSSDAANTLAYTVSGSEDSGAAPGWSIENTSLFRDRTSSGDWSRANTARLIRVIGTAKPNTAPTASDGEVTTVEGMAYTFTAGDFGFADDDEGDTLASVRIATLETAGDLALDGTGVTANQEIAKADIDAGKLKFTPAAGRRGDPYATFTFKVSDGTDESADAYTMTIDVTAAALPANTLVSNAGQATRTNGLSLRHFDQAQAFTTGGNAPGYTLTGVRVRFQAVADDSVTYDVDIWSSDEEVDSGADTDTLDEPHAKLADLTCGALAAGTNVACTASGTGVGLAADTTYIIVVDSSSDALNDLANTNSDSEDADAASGWSIANTNLTRSRTSSGDWSSNDFAGMILVIGTATPNTAPTATDNTVTTDRNTEYTFTAADFGFTDIDAADTLASVKITTLETAGDLELDGTDVELDDVISRADIDDEKLTFTPASGATGDPYATFGFKVNDGTDESAAAYTMTVDVKIANLLVSNVGQTSSGGISLAEKDQAQAFTTGGNGPGYTLTGVQVRFQNVHTPVTYDVDLWSSDEEVNAGADSDTLDEPHAKLADLTCATIASLTNVLCSAAGTGFDLDANTTYLFVVDSSRDTVNRLDVTLSDNEDSGGAPGWSIENNGLERDRTSTGGWTSRQLRMIRVLGTAKPHTAPTVESVEVTSTPRAGTDTYGAGEEIEFTVTFSAPVEVTGSPHFTFSLGNSGSATDREAAYESGSGTTALVFAYTVQAADEDDNGIFIEADGIGLDSGEHIRIPDTTVDADLDHERGHTQSGHKVDGSLTPPTATALVSNAGQSDDGSSSLGDNDQAQAFTTGDHASGYTLTGAEIRFRAVPASSVTYAVGLWSSDEEEDSGADSDAVDEPHAKLADLTCGATAVGNVACTAAGTGYALAAGTTYVLVVDSSDSGGNRIGTTSSDNEDSGRASGWSIANNGLTRFRNSGGTDWFHTGSPRQIRVIGTAKTPGTNTAPTASDGTVTAYENTGYAFETSEFNFADDDAGDMLASVKITTLPGPGKGGLELDGTAIASSDLPQTVTRARLDAGGLVYDPPSSGTGDGFATFRFKVSDGTEDSASAYTMTVDVRDAPTFSALVSNTGRSQDGNRSLSQYDQAQAFTTGGNADGYVLTGVEVRFGSVANGSVIYDVDIWSSDEEADSGADSDDVHEPHAKLADLTCGDLDAGSNVACAADGTGFDLDADTTYLLVVDSSSGAQNSLRITHSDDEDSGRASGWSIEDTGLRRSRSSSGGWSSVDSPRMIRVNGFVKGLGTTPPTAADRTLRTAPDTTYTFAADDFNFSDADGDALASVRITAVESAGDLEFGGRDVTEGQVIAAADLDDGDLTFAPDPGASGEPYATFRFRVSDGTFESAPDYAVTIDVGPPSPPAATVTALVSNTGRGGVSDTNLGTNDLAQAFTTGDHALGYRLTSVEVRFQQVSHFSATYDVGLWSSDEEADSGADTDTLDEPHAKLGDLSCEALAVGNVACTAAAGFELAANTTYLVVIDSSSAIVNLIGSTTSADEDDGRASGWSIENTALFRRWHSTGGWTESSDVRMIRVNGFALTGRAAARLTGVEVEGAGAGRFRLSWDPLPAGVERVRFSTGLGATSNPNHWVVRRRPDGGLSLVETENQVFWDTMSNSGRSTDGQSVAIPAGEAPTTATFPCSVVESRNRPDVRYRQDYDYPQGPPDLYLFLRVRADFRDDRFEPWTYPVYFRGCGIDPGRRMTSRFLNPEDPHDGSTPFDAKLELSLEPADGFSYKVFQGDRHRGRPSALQVTNGTVERARRDGEGQNRRWLVTIRPTSDEAVIITLPATTDCSDVNAICTTDGAMLSEAVTKIVPGPATRTETETGTGTETETGTGSAPLAVAYDEAPPAEHDGESAFTFTFSFSENLASGFSYRTIRDHALRVVQGGTVHDQALRVVQGGTTLAPAVRRKVQGAGNDRHWVVTVTPDGHADIRMNLSSGAACGTDHAICTADDRALSNGLTATVQGPPGLSVANARVEEAAGATADFAVTLSRAASGTVTVDYATSDGTATAGSDYTATSGTLTFAAGETEKTVSVPVLDDDHDEDEETFTLTLSNVQGNAYLADGEAEGTIENSDAMPGAWLARFGRTVAEQALDAVRDRMSADRSPGFTGRFAGQPLPGPRVRPGAGPEVAADATDGTEGGDGLAAVPELTDEERRVFMALLAVETGKGLGEGPDDGGEDGDESRAMTADDILLGTSFGLVREADGLSLGLWGRAARSGFAGRAGNLSLDGEATSVMLGTDWKRRDALFGLMLLRSRGEGTWKGAKSGAIDARMSALVPWAAREVGDGLSVWGAAGTGRGEMTLTPDAEQAMTAGLGWSMAAAGVAGAPAVVDALGGARVGWTADALWTRTASDAVRSEAGSLAASAGETSRVRLGLDAAWSRTLASGATLTPRLEAGLRHDGGDAETGFGLEFGGGVRFADPARGLSVSLDARALALHRDRDFGDRGVALSVSWDPRPETRLGPSVIATRGWGGASSGGVAALLDPETLPGGGTGGTGSLGLEMAWGTDLGAWRHGTVGTAYGRLSGSPDVEDLRLGWRVAPDDGMDGGMDRDVWVDPGAGGGDAGIGAGLSWARERSGVRSSAGVDLSANDAGGAEAGLRLEWEW